MTLARFLITGQSQSLCEAFIAGFTDEKHHLQINAQLSLSLTPASLHSPLWEDEGYLGAVLLLEDDFSSAPQIIAARPDLAFIIAVVAAEKPSPQTLQSVRDLFPEESEIKVFPCVANDPQAAQNVLLALIYQILS